MLTNGIPFLFRRLLCKNPNTPLDRAHLSRYELKSINIRSEMRIKKYTGVYIYE